MILIKDHLGVLNCHDIKFNSVAKEPIFIEINLREEHIVHCLGSFLCCISSFKQVSSFPWQPKAITFPENEWQNEIHLQYSVLFHFKLVSQFIINDKKLRSLKPLISLLNTGIITWHLFLRTYSTKGCHQFSSYHLIHTLIWVPPILKTS